jgi:hypothetical protein
MYSAGICFVVGQKMLRPLMRALFNRMNMEPAARSSRASPLGKNHWANAVDGLTLTLRTSLSECETSLWPLYKQIEKLRAETAGQSWRLNARSLACTRFG